MTQVGREEAARDTLTEALEVARSLPNTSSRASALSEVAASPAQVGREEAALEAARSIEDASGHAYTLSKVAASLAQFG